MKKVIALILVTTLLPSLALAVGNHPMAGCGLGYILLSNQNNDKVTQILGATTNHTGVQTFGISSGTSGCTEDGAIKVVRQTEVFVEVNFDSLRREMAIGRGEYAETLAILMGATPTTQPAMLKFFKMEYASLFPSVETTPGEMLQTLSAKLAVHQELLG